MNVCKKVRFLNLSGIKLKNYLSEETKKYKNAVKKFISYFNDNWLYYFDNGTLNLDKISIKFRTNNCLERYNRSLIENFNNKK